MANAGILPASALARGYHTPEVGLAFPRARGILDAGGVLVFYSEQGRRYVTTGGTINKTSGSMFNSTGNTSEEG